ncbi:MAG: 2-hydroxychromene-2-carboxylate isomerase [Myxococcota bacterium]
MAKDVWVFFNYRSPYCYLATHRMWGIEDAHGGHLVFKPLGGWSGRSPPERAKVKMPIARQDVRRWAKRMKVPCVPPPPTTDPTKAALAALIAVERGLIRPYTNAVMRKEWTEGQDIGDPDVLLPVATGVGLDRAEVIAAFDDPARHAQLEENAQLAAERGIFGVPTFLIGDEIFWGQDRIDFVEEFLDEADVEH